MSALLSSSWLCGMFSTPGPIMLISHGIQKPPKPDNTRFVALSVAGTGLIFLSVSAGALPGLN